MKRFKLSLGSWFCLGLGVFWMFAIIPGMLAARDLPGQIAGVNKELKKKVEQRTAVTESRRESSRMEEGFGALINTTREAEHSAHLVRESNRVCVESAVRIISVQPVAPTVRGEFKRYPVQLNVEGDLKGLTKLLLLLRDARPVLDPERVTMRTSGDGKKISAQLTIASFAHAPKDKGKRRI